MIHEERVAPPTLAGIATRAWFLEMPPVRTYEKILPMPFVHVIINLSDPYRIFAPDGTAVEVADVFVSGLQSTFLLIQSPPLIRHVGIELTSSGLHQLSASGPGTAGRVQDARAVFAGMEDLVRQVRSDLRPGDAIGSLLDHFTRRADSSSRDLVVEAALTAIDNDPEARIGILAANLGVSPRALLTRFRAVTGTTPKGYAQVLRFHRFVDAVHAAGGRPDWTLLAAESGYYDQPDVIRAFHRFSGWTPSAYFRLVAEHGPAAAHFVPLDQLPTQPQPVTPAERR